MLSQGLMVVLKQVLMRVCWKLGFKLHPNYYSGSCYLLPDQNLIRHAHNKVTHSSAWDGTPERKSFLCVPDLEEVDVFEDACALCVHAILRHVLVRAT